MDDLCKCYEESEALYGDNLGYVTGLVNNNPWGFNQILDIFENTVNDDRVSEILVYLRTIYKELYKCGYEKYLSFDLGMVHRIDYYTGIIFDGFVHGSGKTVLSGGRYDNLISKFGRDLNAVGFGLSIDEVFDVVKTSKKGEN